MPCTATDGKGGTAEPAVLLLVAQLHPCQTPHQQILGMSMRKAFCAEGACRDDSQGIGITTGTASMWPASNKRKTESILDLQREL